MLELSETTQRFLISSTCKFYGVYRTDDVRIDHAWPVRGDPKAYHRWEEGPLSRSAYVLSFSEQSDRFLGLKLSEKQVSRSGRDVGDISAHAKRNAIKVKPLQLRICNDAQLALRCTDQLPNFVGDRLFNSRLQRPESVGRPNRPTILSPIMVGKLANGSGRAIGIVRQSSHSAQF